MDSLRYGKICLVTGASRGIGKGVALELAKSGHSVYITGRDLETLKAVAREVPANSGVIHPIQCDHAVDEEVNLLFEKIAEENDGKLDLLVNNASSAAQFLTEDSPLPFWDLPAEAWDVCNCVGLRNNYRCAVLASRMMVKRRSGLIINVTSIATLAYTLTPPYSVGKCATDRMTLDCAIELKKYNVAFVSLWPGCVKTEHFITTMENNDSNFSGQKEMSEYFLEHGESPSFVGKAVLRLLEDKNIIRRTGAIISTASIARECGFTDGGRRPIDFTCLKDMMMASGFKVTAMFIPEFIRLPRWLLSILLGSFVPDKKTSIYS